jgi:hypothetical protein
MVCFPSRVILARVLVSYLGDRVSLIDPKLVLKTSTSLAITLLNFINKQRENFLFTELPNFRTYKIIIHEPKLTIDR